jgi:hypothetical protein
MIHSHSILVSCSNCHNETSLLNINKHYNTCIKKIIKDYPNDLKCRFCGKECKNKNSFVNHERCCPANSDRKYVNGMIGKKGKLGKKGGNRFTKAKELGLPPPEVSKETRDKLSLAGTGRKITIEQRKILSDAMKLAVKNNPDSYSKNNVSGRVKIIDYNGINLKGSWELKTAQWLDSLNVIWENETNPHDYFWNEGWHKYFPDFFLPYYNSYIEVKGYKTNRDEAKWNQFNDKLIIIDKRNINKLNEFQSIEALSELYLFK